MASLLYGISAHTTFELASHETSIHSLALGGQVVHARPDVLVVIIDLHIKELGLGVEGHVSLLQFDKLSFPALAIPPLIPDILHYKHTQTNEAGAAGNP